MNATLDDLYNLIVSGNKEIKQEIHDLRSDLLSDINELKEKNKTLEEENKKLKARLLGVERKLKKYNVIIYGVQGDEKDTTEKVIHIINNKLHLNCGPNDFRDIFRIGLHSKDKIRPVVLETLKHELKTKILINAKSEYKELQKNHLFFAQDLAQEDYKIRKLLSVHLKEARAKQYNAFIKNNTLVVNGEIFTYDYLRTNGMLKDNWTEAEQIEEQEIDGTHNKTFSEMSARRLISNSAPTTPTKENTNTEPDNLKHKAENTATKDTNPKSKIQTRSQYKGN